MSLVPLSRRLRPMVALALLVTASLGLAHEPSDSPGTGTVVTAESAAAVAVVDAFSAALKAGDISKASSFLHPELLVLESGGAERSREQYLAGHAGADAKFLAGAQITPIARRAQAQGDLAWVASESRIRYSKDGAPKQLLSTETMVLRREQGEWKIVHIHWSSQPAPGLDQIIDAL